MSNLYELIQKRLLLSLDLASIKSALSLPIEDLTREKEILSLAKSPNEKIFLQSQMNASKLLQKRLQPSPLLPTIKRQEWEKKYQDLRQQIKILTQQLLRSFRQNQKKPLDKDFQQDPIIPQDVWMLATRYLNDDSK
ncbi:MAG: hypothetical protein WCP39_00350 [Chlamydiota bacterium]